jgi:8-oxo-dGTP diphosphatase
VEETMKDRATVICRRNGKVLLVRRSVRWALPGGKIRVDETPLDCARRELREEISVDVDSFEYLWLFRGLSKLHHVFVSDLDDHARPQPASEICECRWFTPVEIAALVVSVPTWEIVSIASSRHWSRHGQLEYRGRDAARGQSESRLRRRPREISLKRGIVLCGE